MSGREKKLCEQCDEEATLFCPDCYKFYCPECSESIHKKESKKGHKIEAIPKGVTVHTMCPRHNKNPLELFCVDEVKLCCVMCKEENLHKDHKVFKLTDVDQDNEVFSVEDKKKGFTGTLDRDNKLKERIGEAIESIEKEKEEAEKKIKETFEEVRKKLKQEEDETMKELEAHCEKSTSPLGEILAKLEEIGKYSKVLDEARSEMKESSRLMDLNLVSEMEEQRREMEKLHGTLMTDLKVGWDSEKRKLSFTKTLFNGAHVPNNVSFPSILNKEIKIAWECDDSGLNDEDKKKIKFIVKMKVTTDGEEEEDPEMWKEVYTGADKKCTVTGLEMGTEYNVCVRCTIGDHKGRWSDVALVKTKTIHTPKDFKTKSKTWDSITIKWTAVEDASHYQIETDGNGSLEISTNTTHTKTDLPPDSEHTFRVRAVCGKEEGKWSDLVKGRTLKFINIDSVILKDERYGDIFEKKLTKWCRSSNFELLYRGSTDGFGSDKFHSKCDNQGKTLVLIKNVYGHIYGGFASIPWTNSGGYKKATKSFIFTLTNMHGIKPTQFFLKNENDSNTVYHNSSYCPTFGGGHDIYISSNSNSNTSSYSNFPSTYNDTTGKGRSIFTSNTGNQNFQVQEIEVFRVNV